MNHFQFCVKHCKRNGNLLKPKKGNVIIYNGTANSLVTLEENMGEHGRMTLAVEVKKLLGSTLLRAG